MSLAKIFVNSTMPDTLMKKLQNHCTVDFIDLDKGIVKKKELMARAKGKAGLLLIGAKLDEAFFNEFADTLKIVSFPTAGIDSVDLAAASKYKVMITNAPNTLNAAVSEMTLGLMLSIARHITLADQFMRQNKWLSHKFMIFWGDGLEGKTLGIIGMGKIGQALAKRAKAFGMNITYHNRTRLDHSLENALNARYLSLEDCIQTADFLVLLCPLSNETYHLMNSETLALMKESAYLINVARGDVVDQNALIETLKNQKIKGAALDVFSPEPLLENELFSLPNVVLSPHIASATHEGRFAMVERAVENIIAGLSGKIPPALVNKDVLKHKE